MKIPIMKVIFYHLLILKYLIETKDQIYCNGVRKYCGDNEALPETYTEFGSRMDCMKKGVGIGLTMAQDKRENFQARPVRKLGKKEIMDLAKRLKIPTEDITREASIQRITRRIQELNS